MMSDALWSRPTDSIGSDGVRLWTFSTPPHPELYRDEYLLSLLRTDVRCVWLFMAFFHQTQVGCIGQPSEKSQTLKQSPTRLIEANEAIMTALRNFILSIDKSGSLSSMKDICLKMATKTQEQPPLKDYFSVNQLRAPARRYQYPIEQCEKLIFCLHYK